MNHRLNLMIIVIVVFALNAHASTSQDCGMVPPGATFDKNCKIIPVPPPSDQVFSKKNVSLEEVIVRIGCQRPCESQIKPTTVSVSFYKKWLVDQKVIEKKSYLSKCKAKDKLFYKVLFEEEKLASSEDALARLTKINELPPGENSKSELALTLLLRKGFSLKNRIYSVSTFSSKVFHDGSLDRWRSDLEAQFH